MFSLIGLLRVNCLLCDYTSALKALDPIDLAQKRSVYSRVVLCHVSLYFHMGFAYLMVRVDVLCFALTCAVKQMRRYMDAIKTLSGFLLYVG